jgi:hypothetical protein
MYQDPLIWWLGSNGLDLLSVGYMGSNGLDLLSVGCMDDATKLEILLAEFSTAHGTKNSLLLHHILHLDPLPDHPKSSIGCIKIHCGGWEAMVWIFCQLVAWMMPQNWRSSCQFTS